MSVLRTQQDIACGGARFMPYDVYNKDAVHEFLLALQGLESDCISRQIVA